MLKIIKVPFLLNNQRLDNILVKLNAIESRQKAVAIIMSGNVFLNDKKIIKSGTNIKFGSVIKVKFKDHQWVSRGGIKLDYAINYFKINVKKKNCIDIGSSTGGFTDVLLYRGAKIVFCVDVGYGQLAWKIRQNPKVKILEKFNARNMNKNITNLRFDILVCDVSFISIKKVIPNCLDVMKKNSLLIILIKPQFEVGKENLSKGGIVKDTKTHEYICKDIKKWFAKFTEIKFLGMIESPITGNKGNKEFLINLLKK